MLSAVLALAGALVYGGADFLGGLAAKRMRAIVVIAIAAPAGLLVLLLLLPLAGGRWTATDLWWGALSGILGVVALALLYACLAIGPMSILSPLTAVVAAIAPLLWGLLVNRETLGALGYAGLAVALAAVVLVGFIPGEKVVRPRVRGLVMAVGAGLALGAFLIVIDQTSAASGVVPLVANRATATVLTAVIITVLALRTPGVLARTPGGWWLAAACGMTDAAANVLLLIALRLGDLSVVSALTALYPAGTILLAAVVLRERIAGVQWAGLLLALIAGGMLALS